MMSNSYVRATFKFEDLNIYDKTWWAISFQVYLYSPGRIRISGKFRVSGSGSRSVDLISGSRFVVSGYPSRYSIIRGYPDPSK